MKTAKEDALDLASKLAAAHAAADSPELGELHDAMRIALYRHRAALGLSADDVAEIDNVGPQARGGTPKGPSPEVADEG